MYDLVPDSLESYSTGEDKSTCCDSCTRKGEDNQPATTYCITCSAKYCAKHREVLWDKLLLCLLFLIIVTVSF